MNFTPLPSLGNEERKEKIKIKKTTIKYHTSYLPFTPFGSAKKKLPPLKSAHSRKWKDKWQERPG